MTKHYQCDICMWVGKNAGELADHLRDMVRPDDLPDNLIDPTLDAPPLTDADAPEDTMDDDSLDPHEDEGFEEWVDRVFPPYTEDDMNAESDDTYGRAFAVGQATGDMLGFERGYASAVDDYRHGLWADEVENG